jgi:hypothetical protein
VICVAPSERPFVAAGTGGATVVVAAAMPPARLPGSPEWAAAASSGFAVDAANTHPTQEDGFFRTCVPFEDPRRQYCMFVDGKRRPPTVIRDRDTRPNEVYFRTP